MAVRPLFDSMRRSRRRDGDPALRLVVGLNRVDEIVPGGWDTQINLPTAEAAVQIDRKCVDIIRILSKSTQVDGSHIEYYSALKRYRLYELLNRVIEHCHAGFRFADVEPLRFEDVDGVDPDARTFTREERERRLLAAGQEGFVAPEERFLSELGRHVSAADLRRVRDGFAAQMRAAPRIAVLGQAGVGKTTTVNALFSTAWRTSAVEVGTRDAEQKRVALPSGGSVDILDLPGYGRSIAEDAHYEAIYRRVIPSCDLVLLIIQADRGDLADDQEMIIRMRNWIREARPVREGEETS